MNYNLQLLRINSQHHMLSVLQFATCGFTWQKINTRSKHDTKLSEAEYWISKNEDRPGLEKRKVSDAIGKVFMFNLKMCMISTQVFVKKSSALNVGTLLVICRRNNQQFRPLTR